MVSTARIERPPFYRGGSASIETLLAASPSPLSFRPHLHIQQLDFPMEMTPFDFQFFSCA
jgi:hypothetical protein